MSVVKNLKEISIKSLGYTAKENRKLVEDKGNQKVFIARVGGVVKGFFKGESKNGEYVGFKGLFFAVNSKGERFTSDTAYFPTGLSSKLEKGFGEGVVEIEMPPADIFIVESEKTGTGYAYMSEFTMTEENIKKADAIANQLFNTKLPIMLEAPKTKSKVA